jgi:hypothetical protein
MGAIMTMTIITSTITFIISIASITFMTMRLLLQHHTCTPAARPGLSNMREPLPPLAAAAAAAAADDDGDDDDA